MQYWVVNQFFSINSSFGFSEKSEIKERLVPIFLNVLRIKGCRNNNGFSYFFKQVIWCLWEPKPHEFPVISFPIFDNRPTLVKKSKPKFLNVFFFVETWGWLYKLNRLIILAKQLRKYNIFLRHVFHVDYNEHVCHGITLRIQLFIHFLRSFKLIYFAPISEALCLRPHIY